jgi:hypothetical protein
MLRELLKELRDWRGLRDAFLEGYRRRKLANAIRAYGDALAPEKRDTSKGGR